ncbi:MAG TPA: hypothetical protein VK400_11680 [Pyrinomonadaceae bacterium]|nr:hypothetical protein [Pyrinomonadaceae bacterium]
MSWNDFKEHSKWLSQLSAAVSLIILVYVKSKGVFDDGNFAGKLVLISLIAAILTFIFGVMSLPRRQSFVALGIFGFVAYCFLFTQLYALS